VGIYANWLCCILTFVQCRVLTASNQYFGNPISVFATSNHAAAPKSCNVLSFHRGSGYDYCRHSLYFRHHGTLLRHIIFHSSASTIRRTILHFLPLHFYNCRYHEGFCPCVGDVVQISGSSSISRWCGYFGSCSIYR
jgi:hypothetical protein